MFVKKNIKKFFGWPSEDKCSNVPTKSGNPAHAELGSDTMSGKPTCTELGSDYICLSWKSPNKHVEYYEVKQKQKKDAMWDRNSVMTTDSTPVLRIEGLLQETEYLFKVRAVFKDSEGEFSEQSDPIKTEQSPAKAVLESCQKLQDGNPAFYKLKLKDIKFSKNDKHKTRKLMFGSTSQNSLIEKTIMMIGATGSGKSTLIDGMVNHLLGVKWEDNFRFTIIDLMSEEKEKQGTETVSQTDWITSYKIYPKNSTVRFSLNIIDTPGFGDTRGIERDQEVVEQIKHLFSTNGVQGIESIDAICFVTQAPLSRLTQTQKYIFDSILSVFGKDMTDNIVPMITFADGKEPPVLTALSCANIPFKKHFVFNNSALFESNTKQGNKFAKMFWEMGSSSYSDFFTFLLTLKTKSLQLTAEVLMRRSEMNAAIQCLIPQIDRGLHELDVMKDERELVEKFERQINDNQNFSYMTKEFRDIKVDLKPGEYVTNCNHCHKTCHYPCGIPLSENKMGCAAMDMNGTCRRCPGKCNWTMHTSSTYRIEGTEVEVQKTYEDMKEKYEFAKKEKVSKQNLVDSIKNKFAELKDAVCKMLTHVRECSNYLRENAMKSNPLSEVEYIDILIESEKQDKKAGFKKRIAMLEMLKKQAELAEKAIKINDMDELLKCLGFQD